MGCGLWFLVRVVVMWAGLLIAEVVISELLIRCRVIPAMPAGLAVVVEIFEFLMGV